MKTIVKFFKTTKGCFMYFYSSTHYYRRPSEAAGDGGLRECVPLHRLVVPIASSLTQQQQIIRPENS